MAFRTPTSKALFDRAVRVMVEGGSSPSRGTRVSRRDILTSGGNGAGATLSGTRGPWSGCGVGGGQPVRLVATISATSARRLARA